MYATTVSGLFTKKDNDYSHEEAVRLGKGFCLVQNLFTDIQPDDAACPDFQED